MSGFDITSVVSNHQINILDILTYLWYHRLYK